MILREVNRVGEGQKNIPKLRFKGYEDAWEQRKLGDVADKVTVKNSNLQYIETFTNSAEVGIISQRDYFDHDIANLSNLDGYYIVQKEDFVYNPRISTSAPVGPINRNKLGRIGVMSPLYTVFRTHNVDTTYLEYFFKSQYWHSFMKFHGDSGARADRFSIKDAIFFEMPIPLPDIDEQQKIGDYLNSVDYLITLHQRKYDALKSMKKTLLSKMFPKNGEDVPEIRFKEFTYAWEQRKLEEFLKERTERAEGDEELLSVTINKGVIRQLESDKKNNSSENKSNYKLVYKGDIPYNSMRMWQGAVGVSQFEGIVSPAYTVLIPTEEADGKFLMELFKKSSSLQIFTRWSQGLTSDTWNLKYPTLSKLSFFVPYIKEQNKIAKLLQELDDLITLHQRKLEELKNMKKTLLQQMFV